MCLPNRFKCLGIMLPVGMLFLVMAMLLPRFVHPTSAAGENRMDGLRGFLFGISMGISLLVAVMAARQRRRNNDAPTGQ